MAGGAVSGGTAGGAIAGGFINAGGPGCSLTIGRSSTLPLDIPAISVQLDVRLNGNALPSFTSTTYATSFPRLVLRPRATGGAPTTITLYSGPTTSGSQYLYTPRPLSFRLLPGRYDVGYERNGATSTIFGSFPANEGDVLIRDLAITADGSVAIDIPTVDVTFPVTLNGQSLTQRTSTTYATSFPRLVVRSLADGAPFTLTLFSGPTTVGSSYQYTPRALALTMLPGSYDLAYERNGATSTIFSDFPINEGDVIAAGRSIVASGPVPVDVARVDITLPVTLNLSALSVFTSTTYATSFPRIVLRPRASGGSPTTATLYSGPTTSGAQYQYSPRALAFGVLPGRYDIGYERNGATSTIFGAFPANEGDTMIADRLISTSGPVPVDISTVTVTFPVTLNGQPLTSRQSTTYATSFPRIELRPLAALGAPFTLTLFSGPTTVGSLYEYAPRPLTLTVLPGSYDVAYQRNGATSTIFSDFPINEGDVFASNRVLTTSGPVALDVTRVDVTMPVSLNQVSLTTLTSTTYATSFPRLVLRPLASGGSPFTYALFSGPVTSGSQYQYTPRVIAFGVLPGRYDIGYERNGATSTIFGAFPSNEGDTLIADRAILSSAQVLIDVPTVTVTMPLFLNQQPLMTLASTTYATSFPRIELRPRASQGQPFLFSAFTGPTTVGSLYEYRPSTPVMTILPGTYDVAYRRNGATSTLFGNFPTNEGDQVACFSISQ